MTSPGSPLPLPADWTRRAAVLSGAHRPGSTQAHSLGELRAVPWAHQQVCSTDQPHRTELGPRTLVWIVLAGRSCLGSQAKSQCPSFPAHHRTSGSLLPAAVTRLATSCSGASQELRPQQAPSSQQANSPLNYCCLAVFSRLQSREGAESIASRGRPQPQTRGAPRRRRNLAAAPPPQTQTTSAPACPADPGAPPTTATQDGGAGRGARPAAGAGAGGGPDLRPRGRAARQAHLRPRRPETLNLFYVTEI
ncbi:collectrin isoform X1 [Pseudorca crassidens]|uniref:collectrin isoform X1 n=1 Tax=Pseudorca crassidens TaxID=82174 RepID=UPI00352DBBE3